MKRYLSLLLASTLAAFAGTPVQVQKDSASNALLNSGFKTANGQTIEIVSGSTLQVDSGATFNFPAITLAWSSITGTPTTLSGYGITNAQPLSANLTAFAGLTGATGYIPYFTGSATMSTTALSAFSQTALANTTAAAWQTSLALVPGTNVQAYSPVLAGVVAGTYPGSTSITTVGTVTSGSWSATPISLTAEVSGVLPGANGGSGVANSNTETRGGNVTFSGAYSTQLTVTGNTNVTLPTSGTLLTSASLPTVTLSGDTTGSGTTAITTTTAKVNSVAFPAAPATSTVPVVTGTNQVTYEAVPNAAIANPQVTIGSTPVALGGTAATVAGLTLTAPTLTAPVLGTPASGTLTNATGLPTTGLTGVLQAAQSPAYTGDVTKASGSLTTTVTKVNGVSYAAAPATNTVPVVTSSNTTTYETLPNAALTNSSVTVAGNAVPLGGAVTQDQITGLAANGIVKRTGASTLTIATAGTDYSTPSATETLTNKSISGATNTVTALPNSALTNSAVTVAGNSVSLGAAVTQDQITGLSSTGLVKRTAANTLAVAASGTDYAPATTGTAILYGNGTGGFSLVNLGSGLAFVSGTLSATGSSGSSAVAYTSWANMKAATAAASSWTNGTVVTIGGYYNLGDGGGGDFVWEASDTTADNGGTVMQVTGVTTGRLHRIIPSSNYGSQLPNATLDIRWFGAIPDVTTDCAPGIAAAEASALFSGSNETPALYAPAGQYLLKTKLNESAGSVGSFTLYGDGPDATIFVCAFTGTDTAMWDLGHFATLTSIRNCGFKFQTSTVVLPQYIYVHDGAQLDLQNIRGANFSGTFININGFNTWGYVHNITTANTTGTQILVNGLGGVISDFNLGTGAGTPALMVTNCNALDIHDGQVSGGGPYVSYTGASISTSNSTYFTVTQANHGFKAGDYVYIAAAATHSGYVNRWQIAASPAPTTNTFSVLSSANLGTDTITFGSLWSQVYFGGAGGAGTNCTESSMHNVISNTGPEATVSGSCGFFFDGYSGGGVAGIKCHTLLGDYGNTAVFCHGAAASSFDGTNSFLYGVLTSTASTSTLATGTSDVAVGSFTVGNWYCIDNVGTGNNWTSIGASSAAVGVVFQATGVGAGGTGGTAAALVAHSLKPGGYLRITGGTYAGFWKIGSVTTYTITFNSTLNAGPLITVPAEGDVISSSCAGLTLDRVTAYTGDTFGGIRLEGCNNISVTAPQIATPGGGSHFTTGPFTSIVISDGGQTIPQLDLQVTGGLVTNVGQSAYYPATTKYGINIDGVNVAGVQVTGVTMTGSVTPFLFTNSATPNSCFLNTDFFAGRSTICTLPSGGQSFTSGSAATITWTYPAWDPLGMWASANPARLTPPVGAQLVQLNAKSAWASGVTPASLQIFHYNSGGTLLEQNGQAYGANATPSLAQTVNSGPVSIQPGDYFQVWASQSSGSTATLNNGSPTGNVGFGLTIIR